MMLLWFCTICGCVLLWKVTATTPPAEQTEALKDLYFNTSGPQWLWKYPLDIYGNIWNFTGNDVNPCDDWQGVVCDGTSGGISSITLDSYGLNGTIPTSIIQLNDLERLFLKNNQIYGTIPTQFCEMSSLYYLYLGMNLLTGEIPSCLTTTGYLTYLSLHINYLTGNLPSFTKSSSQNITYLSLTANFLTGSIPDSYKYLTNLSSFYVSYNELTGSLDSIAHMTSLRRLSVANNQFSSSIPNNIGQLNKLQYMYLQANRLYGTIPNAGANFSKLIYFSVYDNYLTGTLKESMGDWTRLQVAAIDGNIFSGTVPNYIGNWTSLQQLTIYDNLFSGTLPSAISTLKYLTLVLVQKNRLAGSPGLAFNRTIQHSLQTIDLSTNHFTGTLPVELFGKQLKSFSAFQTCFDGSIPRAVCEATALETLSLDGLTSFCSKSVWPGIPGSPKYARRMHGTIPDCIWTNLVNITTLQISGNGLSGTIPDQVIYGNLTSLDLSYNSLTGTIPFNLQSWHLLESLNLQSNKFVGDITGTGYLPYSDSLNAVITRLTLANNRLSGIIPRPIEYTRHIDVVEGNLFSCSASHQPPKYDAESNNFVCASNLLDMSLFLFLAIGSLMTFLLLVGLLVICCYYLYSSSLLPAVFEFYCFVNDYNKLESSLRSVKEKKQLAISNQQRVHWIDNIKIFVLSTLWWRSRVAVLINSDLKEKEQDVIHLIQFLKSLRSLRRLTIVLMFLIVIVSVPLYSVLKDYFGTYTVQYRWRTSGVFLSGETPAISLLIFWAVVLSVTLLWIKRTIPVEVEKPYYLAALQSLGTSDTSSSFPASSSGVATEEGAADGENESNKDRKSYSPIRNMRSTVAQSIKRSSTAINKAITYVSRVTVWISIAALMLNVMVVLTMKAGFIYLLVSSNTSFGIKVLIEICLAGLDVIWTAVLVPALITNLPKKRSTSRMLLKSAMLYFNSVIAPCAVIAVADESCFEGLFLSQDPETESFTFDYCNIYNDQNSLNCIDPSSWTSSTQYTPLFYYNYNCYSTIVVEYIPIFLLSYSVLSLLIPLVTAFLITRKERWRILDLFPGVYFLTVDIDMETAKDSESAKQPNGHNSSIASTHTLTDVRFENSKEFIMTSNQIPFDGTATDCKSDCDPTDRTTKLTEDQMSDVSSVSFDQENIHSEHMSSRQSLQLFEKKLSAVNVNSTTKQQIIFPQYILASAIHHLMVMLTFAVMCPSLAVAVALVISSATLTWEVLIGRWMVQDNSLRKKFDPNNYSHQASLSCRDPDILPYIGPFTKKLDALCVDVCCSPTKCYDLLAFGSAIFFACVTVDIAGDKYGWKNSIWLAGVCFGFALVCYCYCNYREIENFSRRQISRFQSRSRSFQFSYDHRRHSSNIVDNPLSMEVGVNEGSISEKTPFSSKGRPLSLRTLSIQRKESKETYSDSLSYEPSRTTSRIELTDKVQNSVH